MLLALMTAALIAAGLATAPAMADEIDAPATEPSAASQPEAGRGETSPSTGSDAAPASVPDPSSSPVDSSPVDSAPSATPEPSPAADTPPGPAPDVGGSAAEAPPAEDASRGGSVPRDGASGPSSSSEGARATDFPTPTAAPGPGDAPPFSLLPAAGSSPGSGAALSSPTALADPGLVPVVQHGAGMFDSFVVFDTGGMALLGSSFGCGGLCYGGSGLAGLLSRAASSELTRQRAIGTNGANASTLALAARIVAPAPPRGPFFSFLTGGGGGGAALLLLGLFAVLVGTMLRIPDWTRAFNLPAVTWRPPVYLPPLESPG